MLFNSNEFLFCFLPITVLVFFCLMRLRSTLFAKVWLLLASLFFYAYWEFSYLTFLIGSIAINHSFSRILSFRTLKQNLRRGILIIGLACNIGFLGYYKYADFLIENINVAFGTEFSALRLLLPLAISFFTFQQIGFLIDSYRQEVGGKSILDYALFVSFFPQLIAGPIVHHRQIMSQLADIPRRINFNNIAVGLFLLGVGLFKKTLIADQLAIWVNAGYQDVGNISMIGSWLLSISFLLQLVFDFTAYSDMAIGIALFFNIHLPINFLSSLKAGNIQVFWQRWHLTLTAFLRNYIYIPLGGNRKGFNRSCINLFIVFMIAGIWHGAGWNFFLWGVLQGIANILQRLWKRKNLHMPFVVGWLLTFNFLNIIGVYFRAPSFAASTAMLKGMIGLHGIAPVKEGYTTLFSSLSLAELKGDWQLLAWLAMSLFLVLAMPNVVQLTRNFRINIWSAFYTGLLIGMSALTTLKVQDEFIYFNF